MKKLLMILVSPFIWLEIIILTIFFTVLICVLSPLYFWDTKRKLAHFLCTQWGKSIFILNPFWKVKVKGLENLDHNKKYIFFANHQSLGDIMLVYFLNAQFKWVAKASLFAIPFLGWSMWLAGYVKLERGAHGSIKKSHKVNLKWLNKRGVSILVFPEGTRSLDGEIHPFKSGAFKLAAESGTPLLPLVIHGTHDIIQKKSWVFNPHVEITLSILPEMVPPHNNKDSIHEVQQHGQYLIQKEFDGLRNVTQQ